MTHTAFDGLLSAAFRQSSLAMVATDPRRPDNPIVLLNPAFLALSGYREEEVLGRNCRFLQGPETDREAIARIATAVREGRPHREDLLNRRRDGTPFWNRLRVEPVRDARGEVTHFLGMLEDVTEAVEGRRARSRRNEARERSRGEELRRLEVAIDEAREAVIITEYEPLEEPGPRIVYASSGFERLTGYAREEVLGRSPRFLQGPATPRGPLAVVRASLERGDGIQTRSTNHRKDGTTYEVEWSIVPVRDAEGRPTHWVSVQRDVSDEVALERQRALLAGELEHRIRNLFQLVSGIAGAAVADGQSAEAYRGALRARLRALAEAHRLVFEGAEDRPEGAEIDALAGAVLGPIAEEGRVARAGPPALLPGREALHAALALHELATNAVKHGALGASGGHVDLAWREVGDELWLDWTEIGGPATRPPERQGFGTRMLEVIASAQRPDAGLDYSPEGLRCRLAFALSK